MIEVVSHAWPCRIYSKLRLPSFDLLHQSKIAQYLSQLVGSSPALPWIHHSLAKVFAIPAVVPKIVSVFKLAKKALISLLTVNSPVSVSKPTCVTCTGFEGFDISGLFGFPNILLKSPAKPLFFLFVALFCLVSSDNRLGLIVPESPPFLFLLLTGLGERDATLVFVVA